MANTQNCNSMRSDGTPPTVRARPSRRRTTRKTLIQSNVQEQEFVVSHAPNTTCESHLLAAVSSLYDDNLRPFGRLVRKRLGEIAVAHGESPIDGDLARLRRTCNECSFLNVEPGEGSEWSVLLKHREPTFIDVYSTVDAYPASLWTGIKNFLRQLDERGESLPGGRYSCARALLDSGLPSLQGCSLGEVCHIVQLAMSEKKLLGYLDGTIAPYERSNSMLKDTAAELCMGSSNTSQQIPLATWASARSCMVDVLESAVRKGKKQVPISTLKRLFRSRFHIELSETALGHTKLSDLLQDKVFSDLCSVRLLERGYVVLPSAQFLQQPASISKLLNPTHHEQQEVHQDVRTDLFSCKDIRNTFIQMNAKTSTGAKNRAQSVPKDVGSKLVELDCDFNFAEDRSTDVGSGSLSPTLTASPLWTPRQFDSELENDGTSLWQEQDLYLDTLGGFATVQQFALNPVMDFDNSSCVAGGIDSFSTCHFSFPTEAWTSQSRCCAPTWMAAVEPVRPQTCVAVPEYLSKKACDGSIIRNTFIELPISPCPEASHCRAQSVPRNVGSDRAPHDDTFIIKLPAVDLSTDNWGWTPQTALASPTGTASPSWSPRCEAKEPTKCVLRLSQFL